MRSRPVPGALRSRRVLPYTPAHQTGTWPLSYGENGSMQERYKVNNMDKSSTSSTKSYEKDQQTTQNNISTKRQKQMALVPSSIIPICSTLHSNVFDGDVLALYGPSQNKYPDLPTKASFVHVDLVDKNGQLTMTVNINNDQIARFLSYFSFGKSVRIKDFATRKKGMYDRGDGKYTILLQ